MSRSQEHPEVVDLSHQKGGVTTDQEGKAGRAWETGSSAWDMLRCLSDPRLGVDTAAGWKGFKGEVWARMAVWVGSAGVALKAGDLPRSRAWTEKGLRAEWGVEWGSQGTLAGVGGVCFVCG